MTDLSALLGDKYDDVIESAARAHAGIEPGDDWPTNAALGGSLTGTRDDEYRAGMREQATDILAAVLPEPLAAAWDEGHQAGHEDARAVQSTYPEPTPNPYRAERDPR